MIKVENFLGCFKLETGGLIIGWLSLIGNVFGFILCLSLAILLSVYTCGDLREIYIRHGKSLSDREMDFCDTGRGIFIVVLIVVALIAVGFGAIAYCCIKGVPKRDHVRVKPLMVTMAICAILGVLHILSFDLDGLISAIIYGAIYGYSFVVLHSLYDMLRQEYERGFTAQYQAPPGGKV